MSTIRVIGLERCWRESQPRTARRVPPPVLTFLSFPFLPSPPRFVSRLQVHVTYSETSIAVMAPADAPGPRNGDCPPPPRPGAPAPLEPTRRGTTATPLPTGTAPVSQDVVSPQTKAAASFRFSSAKPAPTAIGGPPGPRRPDSLSTTSRRQPFAGGSRPTETFAHATLARLGGQKPVSAPARMMGQDSAGNDDEGVDAADDVLLIPERGDRQLQQRGLSIEALQAMADLKEVDNGPPLLDLPKPPSEGIKASGPDNSEHGKVSQYIHHAERPGPMGHTDTFEPNAPAKIPTDPKSNKPPRKASAEGADTSMGSRKRSIDEADATVNRPKRNKGASGERDNGGVDLQQPSSRSETPVTDPAPNSAPDKEDRRKKSSTSRSYGGERPKKPTGSDGNRSDVRSRPPVTTNTVEETISNLRRWQRHEKDAVRQSHTSKAPPSAS